MMTRPLHYSYCMDTGVIRYTYCNMQKIKVEQHTVSGGAWVAAWLFTIGYLKLTFWQGVLAIILWPYYLGVVLSGGVL